MKQSDNILFSLVPFRGKNSRYGGKGVYFARLLMVCLLLIGLGGKVNGQTNWNTIASGDWNNPAIWSKSGSATSSTYPGEFAGGT
ncbi:MAG TPA: hypothetical protein VIO15_13650, partial [Bacteroidales bacterium]